MHQSLRSFLAMKPIATAVTVPNLGTTHRTFLAPPPLRRRRCLSMGNRSCSAVAKVKAREDSDGDAPRAQAHVPESEAGSRAVVPRRRSDLCELFEGIYLCAYFLAWRIGEVIAFNAEEAFRKFRRDVLEKLCKKR